MGFFMIEQGQYVLRAAVATAGIGSAYGDNSDYGCAYRWQWRIQAV
jgi:hypothetical protein